jgi:hypothetical protein
MVLIVTFVFIEIDTGFLSIESLCGTSTYLLMRACPNFEMLFFFVAGLFITRQVNAFTAKT